MIWICEVYMMLLVSLIWNNAPSNSKSIIKKNHIYSYCWATQKWEAYWSLFFVHRLLSTLQLLCHGIFFLFHLRNYQLQLARFYFSYRENYCICCCDHPLSQVSLQNSSSWQPQREYETTICIHIQKKYIHLTIIVCHTRLWFTWDIFSSF